MGGPETLLMGAVAYDPKVVTIWDGFRRWFAERDFPVQAADEARHVEVFTRRAELSGGPLGTSGAGGRASLQTLLDEPDFSLASFLLSVLGEGTFLD
ncbi:MAG: hypothetical protein ACRDYF_12885, partial [Acidimicrobiia bacterium]